MNGGPSESIEVEALLATSILDADNVPNKNQSETCFSCGSDMLGLFCKDCGQKNDDLRRSIFFLIIEAFTSFFSVESRMWRTWLSLFRRPGQAAREFADGKRTLWTSPVRIYLAMSILLFGYISLTDTRLISVQTQLSSQDGIMGSVEILSDTQVKLSPKLLFFTRQKTIDKMNGNVDFDRVERLLEGVPHARFSFTDDKTLADAIEALSNLANENGEAQLVEAASDQLRNLKLLEIDTPDNLADTIIDEINDVVDEIEDKEPSEKTAQDIEAEKVQARLKTQKKAVSKLNSLLRNYPNMQDVANGLSEGSLPLTRNTFVAQLPINLTEDKRTELLSEIDEMLLALQQANITDELISELKLEIYDKSPLSFNNITINNIELSSGQVRETAMTVLQRPEVLNEAFATYLPRIMFFMMPFAMFAGIVFIRGRKTALMYDHLVHAAYIHAFAYLFLLVLIMLSQWTNLSGLSKFFFLGMVIYLPVSAKYMFKRGWFKTCLTSYSIAFQYSVVMFFIMIMLLAGQISKTAAII